jgi:transaldolase
VTNKRGSEKVERVTTNPSLQIKEIANGMGSDPMRQLMEQLIMMLQQNSTKNSGMTANLILNYPVN